MKFSIAFHIDSVIFTRGVISGKESLGGSESAAVGLARALAARGHAVWIFATKLDDDAVGPDHAGVTWAHAEDHAGINQFTEWDVFVALRMVHCFDHGKVRARLRILWNQDLLVDGPMKMGIMARAYAYDKVVYVSEFHRRQWEELLPELAPLGYVTKNGFDPAIVATGVTKDPNRVIHISRPERGLRPLLKMWPALKARVPDATLYLCRYSSMYDAHGWGEICKRYDRATAELQSQVGGIIHMGELGKASLYHAIGASAVMWYPGVHDFAETSCIAAIEAQANGTPFVGSFKGALPETVPSGVLIPGNAESAEYQTAAVDAVAELLEDAKRQSFRYRQLRKAGLAHVETYTYAAIAAEWEGWLQSTFRERYEGNKLGVLRRLLHYDDHTAAKQVAREYLDTRPGGVPIFDGIENSPEHADIWECAEAIALCDRVIAGKDQGAEDYAERASDPIEEADHSNRFKSAVQAFKGCTHVLDIACGPGSFALALARTYPSIRVTGIDYAAGNIETARRAALEYGVAERCTFIQGAAYDFDAQEPVDLWSILPAETDENHATDDRYDGAFVGEFLEHCGDAPGLIDAIERVLVPDSPVVFTVPYGPMVELIPRDMPLRRGHVHHFTQADLQAVFGKKADVHVAYLSWGGKSPRGEPCGNWLIAYRTSDAPTGERPYAQLIATTRPQTKLSVGILAKACEIDLMKCLESVWGVADEIIVALCGADDQTRRAAQTFCTAPGHDKLRLIEGPPVEDLEDGFAGARNAVLQESTGDAFLWIDTDETVLNGFELHKYLESGPFIGYAMRQTHLMLDAAPNWDTPIRLFRKRPDIQFYGCVHEQPQQGDCNADIHPSLEIEDVVLPHLGYLTEGVRRQKMLERNRALLVRDQERFEDRRLGKVLWIREYVNMADLDREEHKGEITTHARECFTQVVGLFEKYFADPADKYHKLARPFYERALEVVNGTVQVEIALAGKPGGLGQAHAKPSRLWVRSFEDLKRHVLHRLDEIQTQMQPAPLRVDPYEDLVAATTRDAVQEAPAPVA